MHKVSSRIVIVLIAVLLNMVAAHASVYNGGYIIGKFGINNSAASGAVNVPRESTLAYGVQGIYIGRGYNWDVSAVTVGAGVYADINASEKHADGVEYGSRAYGLDVKLGYPINDWLLYGKYGYGYSKGTGDLKAVSQKSPNAAMGAEYKYSARWGAIVEYKIDSFSSKDSLIKISNKTLTFGLAYYFDRPAFDKEVAALTVSLDIPEPELDLSMLDEPPPEIGVSLTPSTEAGPVQDPESWKILQEGKAISFEESHFIPGAVQLATSDSKELDEIAGFVLDKPTERVVKLLINGYVSGGEPSKFNLSLGRIEEIKKYLLNRGVKEKLISVVDKAPVVPTDTKDIEADSANNRRIEISATIIPIVRKVKAPPTPASKTAGKNKSAPDPDSDLDPGLLPP